MRPNHNLKTQSRSPRRENLLKQNRKNKKHIKGKCLHRIESNKFREIRVSNNSQIKSEKRNERSVREGSIERKERNDWLEKECEFRVLSENAVTVLKGIEEWECVCGD
jgi:hypothetical protein